VDAPAPLTERERWLLDRVEQLEKRVADLESKGRDAEAPASAPPENASAGDVAAPSEAAITSAAGRKK